MPKLAAFPKAFMQALCKAGTMKVSEWIELACKLDIDGLEWYAGFLEMQDEGNWLLFRRQVEEHGKIIPMMCCSPDFTHPDEYFRANIYLRYGKIYTGVFVKFNLQENLVLYKLPDGSEMSASVAIKRIIFTDTSENWILYNTIFENGFPPIDKQNENTYYEVMDSGKVKLLKYHSVIFTDKKYYGQASMTRIFDQSETYYICLPGGVMKKLEKGKEEFISLFTDKKTELGKYIEQQKLKCRKENDWKKAIAYYNSLFAN